MMCCSDLSSGIKGLFCQLLSELHPTPIAVGCQPSPGIASPEESHLTQGYTFFMGHMEVNKYIK
jgi:hypothetical protein